MKSIVSSILLLCLGAVSAGCSGVSYLNWNLDEDFADSDARQLAEAAIHGDQDLIDSLLAKGVSVDATGKDGVTPLWWAAAIQNIEGFGHLLSKGADPNRVVQRMYSIMDLAAMNSNVEFMKMSLKHGGDPDLGVENKLGTTPIFTAISQGNVAAAVLLIEHGADLDFQSPYGATPLAYAGAFNQYQIAYHLIKAGAEVGGASPSGKTYLEALLEMPPSSGTPQMKWYRRVLDLLQEQGIDVSEYRSNE